MILNKYLEQIQLEQEINEGDTLKCEICGRVVTVEESGKGPLICCGKPMNRIGEITEAGFEHMPKGWTKKSVQKFANTLAKNEAVQNAATKPGFFDKCVEKMKGKVENPEGFCASVKDISHDSTGWRGKDKSPAEVKQDVKKKEFKLKNENYEIPENIEEDFQKGTTFSLDKQTSGQYKVKIITPDKVASTVPMSHANAKTWIHKQLLKQDKS